MEDLILVFKGITMTNSTATTSPALRTISFDISTDRDRGTTVLIDGLPLEIQVQGDFIGFLPMDLFSARLPLMPATPPRRVPIARCSCGVAQCGTIAPLISSSGDDEELVIWTDFRNLGSAASSPWEVDTDIDLESRSRPRQDDLAFDRVQYESAVLAASVDRTWETPDEATARLLHGMLSTDAAVLRSLGSVLSWVTPSRRRPGTWTVSLDIPDPHRTTAQRRADAMQDAAERPPRDRPGQGRRTEIWTSQFRLRPWEHEPRQVLLELTTVPASPVQQAADLYRQLEDCPPADWERTFPWSDFHRQ